MTRAVVAALVAATLLVGGCSPGPGGADLPVASAPPSPASSTAGSPVPHASLPSPPASPTTAGETDLQELILADGLVTAEEYEHAVQATVDCVRAEGYTVDGPARYPDAPVYHTSPGLDPRDYLYWAAADVEDDEAFYAVSDRCTADWSERVEAAWQAQHAPSDEEVSAWLERAWECLREQGLPLSDPPTAEDADLSIMHGCRPWEADG